VLRRKVERVLRTARFDRSAHQIDYFHGLTFNRAELVACADAVGAIMS
jgi:hypothetical protein